MDDVKHCVSRDLLLISAITAAGCQRKNQKDSLPSTAAPSSASPLLLQLSLEIIDPHIKANLNSRGVLREVKLHQRGLIYSDRILNRNRSTRGSRELTQGSRAQLLNPSGTLVGYICVARSHRISRMTRAGCSPWFAWVCMMILKLKFNHSRMRY